MREQCPKMTEHVEDNILGKSSQAVGSDEIKDEGHSGSRKTGRQSKRKSAKRARLSWHGMHDTTECKPSGGVNGESRIPPFQHAAKGDVSAGTELEIPLWAKLLSSVEILPNGILVGVADSKEMVNQVVEFYSRSILCDFIKSHTSATENRHSKKSQSNRLVWRHSMIKYDGVPFTIWTSFQLGCIFSMNYKYKVKNSLKCKVNRQAPQRRNKDVTFTACPAKIRVKVINKYPDYAIELNAVPKEKKAVMVSLRRDVNSGIPMTILKLYHMCIPLVTVHNHPMTGRARNIHPSVVVKIKELFHKGVSRPKAIKALLNRHIEAKFTSDALMPQPTDRAYFPELKDIGNIIYLERKKSSESGALAGGVDPVTRDSRCSKKVRMKRNKADKFSSSPHADGGRTVPRTLTLQEAVETFCKDDVETEHSALMKVHERGTKDSQLDMKIESQDVLSLIEIQLNSIRSIAQSVDRVLQQQLHQSLQMIIDHHSQSLQPDVAVSCATSSVLSNTAPTKSICSFPRVDHDAPSNTLTFILSNPHPTVQLSSEPAMSNLVTADHAHGADVIRSCDKGKNVLSAPILHQIMAASPQVPESHQNTSTNSSLVSVTQSAEEVGDGSLTQSLSWASTYHLGIPVTSSSSITGAPSTLSSAVALQALSSRHCDNSVQLALPHCVYYLQE